MHKQHALKLLSFLVLACAVAGCGGGTSVRTGPVSGDRWTVLIYMAADNDLEQYAIQDINEMEMVGSTEQTAVVVQIDRSPGYDRSNGDWETTRRYYILRDTTTSTINSQLIADLGELDMAAAETLADFVSWGTQTYPADHYLLVLWDHGRGWRTRTLSLAGLDQPVKAIHTDDTDRSEMSLSALSQALQSGPRMDVILFDACLMGMLEVAYSIKDYADFMAASEDNIPAQGQPYHRLLQTMAMNAGLSPYALSRTIVDQYMAYYSPNYTATLTFSAIDLGRLNDVVTATDGFAQAMMNNLDAARSGIRTAQQQTQYYDADKGYYSHYKDLYDFARLVNSSVGLPDVQSAAQTLMTSINDSVVYQRNNGGKVAHSHGISIYLPDPGSMLAQYNVLAFSQDTLWNEFLAAY
jgi:hypothetical protein